MNRTADSDHARPGGLAATAARARLVRAPGILFLTAALLVPVSGVMAIEPDAPALPLQPATAPSSDDAATPKAAPATAALHSDPAPADTGTATPRFSTGDRLDADDRAAFLEWVAAQKADGKHRGIAVYSSW